MSDGPTPLPTAVTDVISPAAAVEALGRRGVKVSERTLREKARRLGAYHQIGRAIFFTQEDLAILIAPERAVPSPPARKSDLEVAKEGLRLAKLRRRRSQDDKR